MRDIAAERGQFGRGEELRRAAVTPVDAVGQGISRARRITANEVERVRRPLGTHRRARQQHRRSDVVHRHRPCAGIAVLAVFVSHQHRDRAVDAAVGIRMRVVAKAVHHLNRAVAPIDGVAGRRVLTRVGDRAQGQREARALIHRQVAGERDRRRHVIHGERPGLRPGAVLVGGIHRDRARGAAGRTVGIGVGDAAAERDEFSRGECGGCAAVTPVDRVARDRVGAGVAGADGQGVQRALGHTAPAGEIQRRRHVVHRDLEAVAARLRAVIIDRDRDRVARIAVGVGVADAERRRVEGPAAAGAAVAPVDGVQATHGIGVAGIGKADRGHKVLAFVHREIAAGIDRQHLGWCADLDELCINTGVGAVLIHQSHRDRALAGSGVAMVQLPILRQVAGGDHLHCRAITPVDAVFGDGVGARVIDTAQGQRVRLALLHRGIAEQVQVGRHIGHHHLKAVGLDAVGLSRLVVGGHGHRVSAVIREVMRDVVHRRTGRILRRRRAITPIHRDQVSVGVRIAERERVAEPGAFGRGIVSAGLQRGCVIDVGEVDDREHRSGRIGHPIAARPCELVETEVIKLALIAQLAGLQVGKADLLTGGHRNAIELQHALGRQRGDADRRQVLAFGIGETVDEELGLEHDHRLFQAIDRERRDLRRGVAVTLQVDLEGVIAAVGQTVTVLVTRIHIGRPGHDEAAVGHRGDCRLLLHIGRVAIDQRLTIDLAPGRIVLLQEDVVGVGRGTVLVGPAHHPAAVGQPGDRRFELRAAGAGVDAELRAHRAAIGGVTLAIHTRAAQILPVGAPHHDVAAVLERGDVRLVLVAAGVGIGAEGRPERIARSVETLTEHAVALTIGCAGVGPRHHEAAVGQPGDRGLRLVLEGRTQRRVGTRLGTQFAACRVEALEEDVGILGVRGAIAVVIPGNDEAAVGGRGGIGLVLVAAGHGVDLRLPPHRATRAVEDLRIDARAATILAVRAPHHGEATARQTDYAGLVLRICRGRIDTEFTA